MWTTPKKLKFNHTYFYTPNFLNLCGYLYFIIYTKSVIFQNPEKRDKNLGIIDLPIFDDLKLSRQKRDGQHT